MRNAYYISIIDICYTVYIYGSYDPEVRYIPHSEVALDLILKAHNEYLRILKLYGCLRIIKSHEYSICA